MITTEVKYDSYLAQLAEEVVDSYDTSSKAVTDIVADLLAFQRKATKVTKGTIAPTDTRALKVEDKTILAALLQLKESVGGYIYVDNNRALQWATSIGGEPKGQQIRYRKNLKGITKETNYNDLCTKLHLLGGGGIKLSDIDVVKEEVDKNSDDDYGYLTLVSKYACYKDWVGVDNDLPVHITVHKELPAAISLIPADWVDPDTGWTQETNAYDENLLSAAFSSVITGGQWTTYLQFELVKQLMTGARFYCGNFKDTADGFNYVQVGVTENGTDWELVYSDSLTGGEDKSNQWVDVPFDTQVVYGIQIRFRKRSGDDAQLELNEIEGRTDYQDDSEVWKQGANERTLRCAKGKYDVDSTYFISYTHAGYLVAWDKIETDDDFVSKTLTNKYEAYAASLLEAGRLLLDEVKAVPVSYSIKTVDLSESEEFNFDFDALELGSIIKVIDEELGISVSVRVVKIVHPDLLHPEDMEIEITTRTRDITDIIANMYHELGS